MATTSMLTEAAKIVKVRREGYGSPETNFQNIATMWSVIFNIDVSPRQVAQAMIALKLCRDINKADYDNMLDIAGYADCGVEVDK